MSKAIHPFNDRKTAICKYEPIELNGLVYHPITMEHYTQWQALKPVLCIRQGTLPAVYACMTYLQCVWALNCEAEMPGKMVGFRGIWNSLAYILFLSLRLSDEDMIQPLGNQDSPNILTSIRIVKDGKAFEISAFDFQIARKLIADQNGAVLPDEADNPELVEAADDIRSKDNTPLHYDMGDMLTSVACAKGIRRNKLFAWPIREFEDELRALKRKYGYFLAAIAECNNARFSNGNPYPSWLFDREKDEYAGLVSMEQLQAAHHASITQQDQRPM